MLVIYQRMMDFAMAPAILSPRLRLMDILARQVLLPAEKARFEAQERNGALSCAREMCARRGMDLAHAERVREYAVLLFEKLKKLHGVSGKKRDPARMCGASARGRIRYQCEKHLPCRL